jgi:hypothetical protein
VADRDLPAVGEAGLRGRRGLAVDDANVVALLAQELGRSDAEQAGAEGDNFHDRDLQRTGGAIDVMVGRSPAAPAVLGT